MGRRLLVIALVAITALYCWGLFWIAWGFSRAGGVIGWGLALAVAILLVLTVWVTWREILFGLASARLARAYDGPIPARARRGEHRTRSADDEEGQTHGAHGETTGPSSSAPTAREEFDAARAAVEQGEQDDWQAWYRLCLAYDALRDRKDARMALRRAIDLEAAERRRR